MQGRIEKKKTLLKNIIMVFISCMIKVRSVDVIFNQVLGQKYKTDTCLV